MKFIGVLIVCLFYSVLAFSQGCPPNLDFEMGDYTGWEYATGKVKVEDGKNVMDLKVGPRVPGRHDLISKATAGLDPYGGFPTLCPYGGNYSFKLGNASTGAEAESIYYTFTVPNVADTFTFTFFYAVVFQDPQHIPAEQPRFFATAYDVLTGELINCASYDFIATGSIPGFKVSEVDRSVLYKTWSPVSIQFSNLANREVRLEFRTADCTRTGHFGYAYIDVGTQCSNILATAPYCIETNSLILNAPYGFSSYTWYNNDFSTIMGHGQSLTLSPAPTESQRYYVDLVPYPGYGCRDTTYAIVKPEPVPDTPVAASLYIYCQSANANPLYAEALPEHDLLWYTSETGGIGQDDAPKPSTLSAGTYYFYVSQKKLFGCESFRKKITVIIKPAPAVSFLINNSIQCYTGNNFLFNSTTTNLLNPVYNWDMGNNHKHSSTDGSLSYMYPAPGTYNVKLKVTNDGYCSNETTLSVKIIPKPLAAFDYPSIICEKQTAIVINDRSAVPQAASNITHWWWDINGAQLSQATPAVTPFMPADTDPVVIRLAVKTREGCLSDTATSALTIHHKPVTSFTYTAPLCDNVQIKFNEQSSVVPGPAGDFVNQWTWQFDNNPAIYSQNIASRFDKGLHYSKLTVQSNAGCKSDPVETSFTIHPKPQITAAINDSCVAIPLTFTAVDVAGTVQKWNWDFVNVKYTRPQVFKTYSSAGAYPFTLIGETAQNCKDTLYRAFVIYDNKSFAGKDTLVAVGQPVYLNAKGGPHINYTWHPSTGLSNPAVENPVAVYDKDIRYDLHTVSDKGCIANSSILIKRYKGPALYIPSAFTPNGDGLNDIFKVTPVGILKFSSMAIYNRWGQMVFHTTDYQRGWDGKVNGVPAGTGSFVVIVTATDYKGNPIMEKNTLTLIR